MDGVPGLVDMGLVACGDLPVVLGGEDPGRHFQSPGPGARGGLEPGLPEEFLAPEAILGGEGHQVQVGGTASRADNVVGSDAHKVQPLGKHRAVSRLDLVGQQKEERRHVPFVGFVHQKGPFLEHGALFLQEVLEKGPHEGVPRVQQDPRGKARSVQAHAVPGEAHPFVF